MPKKIKVVETKKLGKIEENEKIKSAKKKILLLFIIGIIVVVSIGLYILIRDRGYEHSSNPIANFLYSEGYFERGYDVYEIECYDEGIYAIHNLGEENELMKEKWSKTKLLNFNEELYESGILDLEETYLSDTEEEQKWRYRLEILFEDGTTFASYGIGRHPEDTEKFKELIKKYFNSDITL